MFDIGQKSHSSLAPTDIVIIAIDENSLSQLGRWPWSRKIHADLIQRLVQEKPRAIGFDVIFQSQISQTPQQILRSRPLSNKPKMLFCQWC